MKIIKNFLNISSNFLLLIVQISFIIVSLIQSVAIYSFFRDSWEWWSIPSFLASGFIGYIPVLGNVCGYFAMHNIWGYSSFTSILIAGFSLWLLLVIIILNFLYEKMNPIILKLINFLKNSMLIFGVVFGVVFGKFIFNYANNIKNTSNAKEIIKEEKEKDIFIKSILEAHPEVEKELINLYLSKNTYDKRSRVHQIVGKYFIKDLLNASNEAVYNRMKEELEVMNFLNKKDSASCIAFFEGNVNDILSNIVNLEDWKKANIKIIKSSSDDRFNFFIPDNNFEQKLIDKIPNQYKKLKYNIEHLQEISSPNIDNDKKCKYMIEFSSAILSLSIGDAVYFYKNMVYKSYSQKNR